MGACVRVCQILVRASLNSATGERVHIRRTRNVLQTTHGKNQNSWLFFYVEREIQIL